MRSRMMKSSQEIDDMKGVRWTHEDGISDELLAQDDEYNHIVEEGDKVDPSSPAAKKKCNHASYVPSCDNVEDPLPKEYQHI